MEFSADQRLFLSAVCTYFHEHARWPTYGEVDVALRDHEDLDLEVVGRELDSFMYDGPHFPLTTWDPTRMASLCFSALHSCVTAGICPELAADLDAFMLVVGLCIEKFKAREDNAQITETEVLERFGMDSLMGRKVFLLMQIVGLTNGSSHNGTQEEPKDWAFKLSPFIRRYRKVVSLEDFLAVRHQMLAEYRQVSVSPGEFSPYGQRPPTWPHLDAELDQQVPPNRGVSPLTAAEDTASEVSAAPTARMSSPGTYEFDVAISFARPERELAERLAKLVKEAGYSVFYDGFYPERLWGEDLPTFFDETYRKKSRYFVPFISQAYNESMWTVHERRSAVARLLEERGGQYVLQVVVKRVEVPGIPPTIGYLALSDYSIEQIAEILIKKLEAAKAATRSADLE